MHRKETWAVFIVIAFGAGMLVYAAANAIGQILIVNNSASDVTSFDRTSGWQTYNNSDFRFSVQYPADWQISTAGLSANDPYVAIGNPLQGISTYAIDIFIENNSSSLSSIGYVHQFLAAEKDQDEKNALTGPSPTVSPQFSRSAVLNVGNYAAFELFNVFEFDRTAERIYVAHGNIALRFDFPSAQENPNLSFPVKNNEIAHEIVGTLTFQN
jgi:hypothetical protein